MWSLFATVGLQLLSWFFAREKDKEKRLKVFEEWMRVMRREFLASADIANEFDDMMERAKNAWKEG